jgi:cytochrome c553
MPKHIIRLLLLLFAFLAASYAGIVILTDPSFYRFGHYRADAVPELAAGTPRFRGTDYCSACHLDRHREWSEGPHVKVKCEVCHGPAGQHPASGKLPVPADPVKLCSNCHRAMPARPKSQPQIVLAEHPFPHETPVVCSDCHNPHSPKIGRPAEVVQPFTVEAEAPEAAAEAAAAPRGATGIPLAAASCAGCHGQAGEGVGGFPPLAGIEVTRFVERMSGFKTGETPSAVMSPIARGLSDGEIRELANFYAGLEGAER